MVNLLADDLEYILEHTRSLWEDLREERLFITGGTGFFGRWLLESFAWAHARLALGSHCTVLTRNPAAFARKAPHLASNPALGFIAGDVRDFPFPEGSFSHVIHAATDATSKLTEHDRLRIFETTTQGTRRVLEYARNCGARRVLFTSSGAVYGRQPPDLSHVVEDFAGAPETTDPLNAYAEGKRAAEMLGVLHARINGFEFVIARGFAFVGPFLPLDAHFAVGNFIRDGLAGQAISVRGDGSGYRSYLYAADLAIWLWTILLRGQNGRSYNVGSDQQTTIGDLAGRLGAFLEAPVVFGAKPSFLQAPERYVPSVARARSELGLQVRVNLDESLRRTLAWHRGQHDADALLALSGSTFSSHGEP